MNNCYKVNQHDDIIKYLEKNEINTDSLKKEYEELIKYIKFILKIQQSFKSEGHNIYTEIINKIALSPNDDKRIISIEAVATYANETNKDLMSEKKKKLNIII